MRIEEKMLILPSLYIINNYENITISVLIEKLTILFQPIGEDAAILKGRNDTKFSQKVRNLKSHREDNGMDKFTTINSRGKYTLTPLGKEYLKTHLSSLEYLFSNNFNFDDMTKLVADINNVVNKKKTIFVYNEQDMVTEGNISVKETKIKKRSNKLRKAAIDHYKNYDGKLYCLVCGFCFEDHYGDLGRGFIEIHHEKPIYQYSDDGFENYIKEAVALVKPICSNCHRMIHRYTKNQLSITKLKNIIK